MSNIVHVCLNSQDAERRVYARGSMGGETPFATSAGQKRPGEKPMRPLTTTSAAPLTPVYSFNVMLSHRWQTIGGVMLQRFRILQSVSKSQIYGVFQDI